MEDNAAKAGPIRRCSQCEQMHEVCAYKGAVWCLECRLIDRRTLPSLPETSTTRREIVVQLADKTYRFRSKSEARRVARTILQRERLPSAVSDQIENG